MNRNALDSKDVRLIWFITQEENGFALTSEYAKSIRRISRLSGLDRELVRRRLAKMKRTGFLKEWLPLLNPTLLGEKVAKIWFDVDLVRQARPKQEILEEIRSMPGVIVLVNHLGTSILLLTLYRNETELRRTIQWVKTRANGFNITCIRKGTQGCAFSPSVTDWILLKAVFASPSASTDELAIATTLSARTVRRKLAKLVQEGVILSFLTIDASALDGMMYADLLVVCAGEADKARVEREVVGRLRDCMVHANLMDEVSSFGVLLPSASRRMEILRWVTAQPGVLSARIEVAEEMVLTYQPLHELSKAKIALELSRLGLRQDVQGTTNFPREALAHFSD